MREVRLLRQLAAVMQRASAAGGFFDTWMKQQSDLVQATAQAYGGKGMSPSLCMMDLQGFKIAGFRVFSDLVQATIVEHRPMAASLQRR